MFNLKEQSDMEEKINIAEILKDKKDGIRLYSPIFGECTFCCVREDTNDICVKKHNGVIEYFNYEGLYFALGELMLFPSKEMRDWSKLSWKKGDVLKNTAYEERVIFDGFLNDDYTYFKGKHPLDCSNKLNITYHEECNCFTGNYRLESEDAAQTYIKTIEEKLCGKLNRETLEVEKDKPKFKDGDIVCISGMGYLAYGIVKSIDYFSKTIEYYVLNDMSTLKFEDWLSFEDKQIQPITETQQIILFDAIARENKAWDAEKIQIVDLKPKVELKPFDKVLVRDGKDEIWEPAFFFRYLSQFSGYNYQTVGGEWRVYCIPYIGNESLLGTTKDMDG